MTFPRLGIILIQQPNAPNNKFIIPLSVIINTKITWFDHTKYVESKQKKNKNKTKQKQHIQTRLCCTSVEKSTSLTAREGGNARDTRALTLNTHTLPDIMCLANRSWSGMKYMKSSFAKTDKRHPKIELFMSPCGLYYLVFNVKNIFLAKTDNNQYVYLLKLTLFRR